MSTFPLGRWCIELVRKRGGWSHLHPDEQAVFKLWLDDNPSPLDLFLLLLEMERQVQADPDGPSSGPSTGRRRRPSSVQRLHEVDPQSYRRLQEGRARDDDTDPNPEDPEPGA